jgi:hypothetical protein
LWRVAETRSVALTTDRLRYLTSPETTKPTFGEWVFGVKVYFLSLLRNATREEKLIAPPKSGAIRAGEKEPHEVWSIREFKSDGKQFREIHTLKLSAMLGTGSFLCSSTFWAILTPFTGGVSRLTTGDSKEASAPVALGQESSHLLIRYN